MISSQRFRSMFPMAMALLFVASRLSSVRAFLAVRPKAAFTSHRLYASTEEPVTTTTTSSDTQVDNTNTPMGLTPELLKLANAFESIGDDKLRYKQLLYMANQLEPMDAASMIPENQVPGCLSTVYVDGTARKKSDVDDDQYLIDFVGDSDGLLTKGLVALLIRGLSGNTAADIQKVNPKFIEKAGISTSLTPGRNNGFLNMLAVMKKKALQLEAQAASSSDAATVRSTDSSETDYANNEQRPMYNTIVTALQQLKPDKLILRDVSHQHAGHVEAGNGTESHFELDIVAEAFDGLNLVKRHQLVYMMLADVMPKIHALQIQAKSPSEV